MAMCRVCRAELKSEAEEFLHREVHAERAALSMPPYLFKDTVVRLMEAYHAHMTEKTVLSPDLGGEG